MSKKLLFYIVFFAALTLVFYLVLTRIIPGYGHVQMPVLSTVQPFRFESQNGTTVSNQDVAGKVCVVSYFFTTCKGICPKMNTNLLKIYEQFKSEPDFLILSHTVDPETDSVARLKRFSDSLGVDGKTWIFLTGRKDSLYMAARLSYLLDDPKNTNIDINDQFLHTQFLALVDKNQQVRKIYDGLKMDEIASLEKDITALLKEKAGEARFVNSQFR